MKKILPFLILISALAVSGSAAFYSVSGLGKLFAGAAIEVMVMAGSLEFAKLVIATALHRYWTSVNKMMRAYLVIAMIALIGITSAGIYGFLSNAYQVTAMKDQITMKEIGILELKKERFDEHKAEFSLEKGQIIDNISGLRTSLSNPSQIQYIDKETGQLITTSSSSARKLLERQLDDAISRRDLLSTKIEVAMDSLTSMDIAIVEAQANSDTSAELGSLKYIAELTGYPMDVVVNWLLFLLVFVFDPLAVTLIVLANFSFEKAFGGHVVDVIVGKVEVPEVETPELELREDIIAALTSKPDINIEPIIEESRTQDAAERTVLSSGVPDAVADQIKEAFPDMIFEESGSQQPILSETAKKNMSWQEIEKWYKDNSV